MRSTNLCQNKFFSIVKYKKENGFKITISKHSTNDFSFYNICSLSHRLMQTSSDNSLVSHVGLSSSKPVFLSNTCFPEQACNISYKQLGSQTLSNATFVPIASISLLEKNLVKYKNLRLKVSLRQVSSKQSLLNNKILLTPPYDKD